MALTYQSGEDIQIGDRVTYGGNAGTIELVVESLTGDPEQDWLLETSGAGVMVAEPTSGALWPAGEGKFGVQDGRHAGWRRFRALGIGGREKSHVRGSPREAVGGPFC